MEEPIDLLYRFGVALVLGLFMGLQREYAYRRRVGEDERELLAGARTFSIIALLGAAAAMSSEIIGGALPFVVGLGAVTFLLAVGHFWQARERDIGLTTEMAALVALFTGALCYWDHVRLAAALGVVTAVVLSLKVQTHALARKLDREDVFATLKFAVITVIVLPLLPREGYGPPPLDVVVPYNVWLMVVLISGISFLGYVLIQIVGPRRGVSLTGILGGLASSTAVTLSVAERSRSTRGLDQAFALAVLLAWAVMLVRVVVEVAIVHPPLVLSVWGPMAVILVASLIYCAYLYRLQGDEEQEQDEGFKNPFRLGPALTFGILYAVILVITNWAESYFGDTGIYISSVVGGLAGIDAVTLSMARLQQDGTLAADIATRAIIIAAAANTLLKGGIVALTGTRGLRRAVVPGLVITIGIAAIMLFLV